MTPNGLGRVFLCRSCRKQLVKPNTTIRKFTTTPPCASTIPSFTSTSSPELDSLLLTYREKVFTPYALSKTHRDLIYKPSRQHILTEDPGVTVTLSNDEEVKLVPMDMHLRPNKGESLNELLSLMQNTNDWNNLPAFLEGMQLAREPVPNAWLQKVVRKANETGKTGVMIRCAEMVKKTGVTLSNPPITSELMLGFHKQASKAGFMGEEMGRAMKHAEQVTLMMDSEHHCGGKLKQGHADMRRSHEVVGVLLELAAANAVVENEGMDGGRKVLDYALRAMAIMSFTEGLGVKRGIDINNALSKWLPMWNGLRLALRVDSVKQSHIALTLRKPFRELDVLVEKSLKEVKDKSWGKPRLSLTVYDEIKEM